MPRKQQGWITFQSSEEERQILEYYCQQSQRTKTEILRELVRNLTQQQPLVQSHTCKPIRTQELVTSEVEVESKNPELKAMKVSARNILRGTIKRVIRGAVNTEVALEIAPNIELISIITSSSAKQLNLSEGKEAYAVIKSSHIMIAME